MLKTLCMLDMKILELFCKFSCAMLMLKFLCAKSYVYNVPVTIFFPTEDWSHARFGVVEGEKTSNVSSWDKLFYWVKGVNSTGIFSI